MAQLPKQPNSANNKFPGLVIFIIVLLVLMLLNQQGYFNTLKQAQIIPKQARDFKEAIDLQKQQNKNVPPAIPVVNPQSQ